MIDTLSKKNSQNSNVSNERPKQSKKNSWNRDGFLTLIISRTIWLTCRIPINGILKIHWLELESSDSNQWILSISLIGIGSVGFQSMDFKYTIDWNPTSFPRTFLAKEFVKLQVSKKNHRCFASFLLSFGFSFDTLLFREIFRLFASFRQNVSYISLGGNSLNKQQCD